MFGRNTIQFATSTLKFMSRHLQLTGLKLLYLKKITRL